MITNVNLQVMYKDVRKWNVYAVCQRQILLLNVSYWALTGPRCKHINCPKNVSRNCQSFCFQITMFYEWMAVGIQDRSSYPAVVYYLSLTADPSAAQLNYTVVYLGMSCTFVESLCLVHTCTVEPLVKTYLNKSICKIRS